MEYPTYFGRNANLKLGIKQLEKKIAEVGRRVEKRFKADCGRRMVFYSLPVKSADLTVAASFAAFCVGLLVKV